MDGGTFATGLTIGLFLGGIGGAFMMCMFTSAIESRQYRPTWPEMAKEADEKWERHKKTTQV